MSIHPILNKAGEVTSVRAIAGKVMGRQVKTCFSVKRYGCLKKAETAASKWIEHKRRELEIDRHSVIAIPDNRRGEIIEAYELLEPYGVRLVDAVRQWVAAKEHAPKDLWQFAHAAEAFLQSRRYKKVRPAYLKSLEDTFSLFSKTFASRVLDEISTDEIEVWLRTRGRGKPIAAVTWRNYRRDLGMVFRFAISRGHATKNALENVAQPVDEQIPIKIFDANNTKVLLRNTDRSVVGIITIMCFAGIRPFEALQLPPENINMDRRFIEVSGPHAKSRQRRLVTMTDNLAAWLQAYPPRACRYWTLRKRLRESARKAGLEWSQDILRHSFGSHHLALHKNAALTAHEMGNSERMVYRHYREVVSEAAARDYFNVLP